MLIMIVEDDAILAQELCDYLNRWGYQCIVQKEFEHVLDAYINIQPHLVLMDINLPYYDGFYWCQKIREISEVPFIYISSRSDDRDKIMAMAQGGDDYIEKPFNLELLKAKIQAMLRRSYEYKGRSRIIIDETLMYDQSTYTLYHNDCEIELTKSEQRIMSTLLEHRGRVLSRDELMVELWNTDEYVSDGTLTTLISRLRTKLTVHCGKELICTKKGIGYMIP